MNDVAGVNPLQCFGDAEGERVEGSRGHRAVLLENVVKRRAGDVLGHHPRALAGGVGVDHGSRMESADPTDGLDLPGESLPEVGIGDVLTADDLDGDQALSWGPAEKHRPHASLAQPRRQVVPADTARILLP